MTDDPKTPEEDDDLANDEAMKQIDDLLRRLSEQAEAEEDQE